MSRTPLRCNQPTTMKHTAQPTTLLLKMTIQISPAQKSPTILCHRPTCKAPASPSQSTILLSHLLQPSWTLKLHSLSLSRHGHRHWLLPTLWLPRRRPKILPLLSQLLHYSRQTPFRLYWAVSRRPIFMSRVVLLVHRPKSCRSAAQQRLRTSFTPQHHCRPRTKGMTTTTLIARLQRSTPPLSPAWEPASTHQSREKTTSTVLSLNPCIESEHMSATTGTASILTLADTIRRQFGVTYFGKFLHSQPCSHRLGGPHSRGVFGEHRQHLL